MILKPGESFSVFGIAWIIILGTLVTVPNIVTFLWIPGPLQLSRVVFGGLITIAPLIIFRIKPRIYLTLLLPIFLIVYADLIHLLDYSKHMTIGSVASFFYTDSNEAIEFLWQASNTTLPTIAGIFTTVVFLYITAPKRIPGIKPAYLILLISPLVAIPLTFNMHLTFPNLAIRHAIKFYQNNQ
jgi:hypothetical protein